MKFSVGFFCAILMLYPAQASATKKTGFSTPVKYEGGNLALNQGKAKVTISENGVVFFHGNRTVSVPFKNITAISCSTDSRRRFGAAVLRVVPMMHLGKAEEHFIGLTWTDEQGPMNEAVLKLRGGEYHQLLAALEGRTGKKAINTRQVPTSVQYCL